MTMNAFEKRRTGLGLTKVKTAELLGVTTQAIWLWEKDKRPIPKVVWLAMDAIEHQMAAAAAINPELQASC